MFLDAVFQGMHRLAATDGGGAQVQRHGGIPRQEIPRQVNTTADRELLEDSESAHTPVHMSLLF